ncbi:unnamed protein product [Mytilus edulis]|uniref:G-protein coupled receptors family 1 profile domain-containing protein n=1 Tax=Mytilus edulis TaxID=6550 RepID=A0A8S3TEL5_MYTED|nr:unnamed protein product [Mytilus edulis]
MNYSILYLNSSLKSVDSNLTETLSLSELNSQEVFKRLPVIVFISILILMGTIGNLHVLYIYYRKFNRSTYRNFVLTLAAIDIVSCTISMPFEIYDELYPYLFQANVACKVFRFINFTLAIATGLMLVVISSERYRRICRPFGSQLTEKQSIYAMIGIIICASGASLPALYVYGIKTTQIPGYDSVGTECTWGDHIEVYVGYIFYGETLMTVIGCMIALVVIYSIVGKYLWDHAHKMSKNMRTKYQMKEPIKLDVIEEETADQIRRARDSFRSIKQSNENGTAATKDEMKHNKLNKKARKLELPIINIKQNSDAPTSSGNTSPNHIPKTSPNWKGQKKLQTRDMKGLKKAFKNVTGRPAGANPLLSKPEKSVPDREKRITIVLFTITVLFIVSFLPYIVILILYSADESYEKSMTTVEHAVYLIGLRLYMINNVANPFLYSSFDSKFKKHLMEIYSFLSALI